MSFSSMTRRVYSSQRLPRSSSSSSTSNSRHYLFAGAFASASFVACAVWEKRSNPSRPEHPISAGSVWKRIKEKRRRSQMESNLAQIKSTTIWSRIYRRFQNISESSKTLLSITALNLAVFIAWKTPFRPVQTMLSKLFLSTPRSPHLLPHIFSSFSHMSMSHLAMNMIGLWSFGRAVHDNLGREQFVFLYSSAAVFSSVLSHIYSGALGRIIPSLGASGAVLAILAAFTVQNPDRQVMLVFLPFISFPAWSAMAALTAFDGLGMLLGWQVFDHAAHLGGILFGYAWMSKLSNLTWAHRAELVKSFEARFGTGGSDGSKGGRGSL